ncbi:MAG TPA: type II secretion system protein [Xanthomonadaceae bacterium]|jgi:general secretion pathway protein I|nr:type II secretion system protein [Xanthomonadaceae bacterium]
MTYRSVAGFTLLEAIVALAILAAGGMALFAALNTSMRAIERANATARLDAGTQDALSRLETLNPMLQPSGEEPLGRFRLRWTATPVEPPRDGLTNYLQPGYFELGLYDLEVELLEGSRVERRFAVRKAGWRQVRAPEAL